MSCSREAEDPVEQADTIQADNLLLITVDTLRADHLGTYGAERPTPGLDALAREGVVFEDAWSASSWTLPSLATLMTGRHARAHGAIDEKFAVDESLPTLAERASEGGIRTWGVGSHIFNGERFGLPRGFAEYDSQLVRSSSRRRESHSQISSEKLTDKAIAFLDAHGADGRWLAWVHYFDPHNTYQPHEGLTQGEEWHDLYVGEVLFTDLHIGRLLAHLDASPYADRTAVVVVADHGEEFEEHGGRMHRRTLFQEVLHVPLIVRAPGNKPGRIATPVSMVDVTPTIYELLDLAPPEVLEGRSLVPGLMGRVLEVVPLVAEIEGRQSWDAVRFGRWKLIVDPAAGVHQLYDLVEDPLEQTDIAAQHTERCAHLLELLHGTLAASEGKGTPVELSAEDRANLEALGYGGDDE